MKLLFVSWLMAVAAADVSHVVDKSEKTAQIVKQDLDQGADGSYQWAYETENGIKANERGSLDKPGSEDASEVVQGEAGWVAPGGEQINFSYIADANGYQPQGSHLPTPPPIPEAIIRALQYIRDHPPPVEKTLTKP